MKSMSRAFNSIEYPIHGRTANECWDFKSRYEDEDVKTLKLLVELTPDQGEVEKRIMITHNSPLVYTNHIIRNLGMHLNKVTATVSVPYNGRVSEKPGATRGANRLRRIV